MLAAGFALGVAFTIAAGLAVVGVAVHSSMNETYGDEDEVC